MKRKVFIIGLLLSAICVKGQTSEQNHHRAYFNAQIAVLNSIDTLSNAQIQKLDSIFFAEMKKTDSRSVSFNIAMSKTLAKKRFFSRFYSEELAKRAYSLYQDDLNYYRLSMNLSDSSVNAMKPILRRRSREIALNEVIYFANPAKRYAQRDSIRAKYNPEVANITLKKESKGATYNLGLVLENRQRLNLSENQVDSIISAVKKIKKLSKERVITKEKNNRWEYERSYIMQFLTEEQVSDFVVIRSGNYALKFARERWQEMEEYEIAFEYDSLNFAFSKNLVNFTKFSQKKKRK
jgi:hypothetical protein